MCSSPWGRKESGTTERLNWTELTPWVLPRWLSSKESACNAGDNAVQRVGKSRTSGSVGVHTHTHTHTHTHSLSLSLPSHTHIHSHIHTLSLMQCFPYPGPMEFNGVARDAEKKKQAQTTAWESKGEETSKFLRLLKCYSNYDISHFMRNKPAKHKHRVMHRENVLNHLFPFSLSLSLSLCVSLSW